MQDYKLLNILKEALTDIAEDPEYWFDINVTEDYAKNNKDEILKGIINNKKLLNNLLKDMQHDIEMEKKDPILSNEDIKEMELYVEQLKILIQNAKQQTKG